ncbi:MAG TPA: sugar phosphate isomerase/epimerase [Candidatus Hydrogenedentes bacterium]|nr:sugar phosphate isomerase/epimerase [Candidatus Hydrogenedentota bacterium]
MSKTTSERLCHVGAQSYSFRNFSTEDAFRQLEALGLDIMEFCAVHFPADAADDGFSHVKTLVSTAGITVPCFGVEGFCADEDVSRKKFAFAKALGVGVLTADPTPDSFDLLDALCDEFQIKIAIHNHGPGARYDKVQDTLDAVEGHSPLIGACLDTGHAIRSDEDPVDVVRRLGARLISLHLKDWRRGGEEVVLGTGDLDLAGLASALRDIEFAGPIVMEYENSPDNPVPEMKEGLGNWCEAVGRS